MDTNTVLNDFAVRGPLPTAAIQWALDNWQVAAPRFLEVLDRYVAGEDVSEETELALFLIVHLFAEKRETAAFRPLCRLLRDAEATECILGDAAGETLSQLLISLHDGDWQVLKSLIEGPDVDMFVRHAALQAWAYFTSTGAISLDETRQYLQELAQTMQPQEPHYAWVGIADAIILLGLNDLRWIVEDLIRRDLITPMELDLEDFDSAMERTLADPERKAGFEYDRVYPFASTIDEFSRWYGFSDEYNEDHAERTAQEEPEGDFDDDFEDGRVEEDGRVDTGAPYINPFRHVGRNDPCPCGSGKKYKKCCLN